PRQGRRLGRDAHPGRRALPLAAVSVQPQRRLGDGMSRRPKYSVRERLRWLVVALAAVMVVAVVGTAPAAKDTLVIGMPTDVPIFDTHKATGLHNGGILNQVSEPLVRLTTDGKVVPWLVE